MKRERKEYNRGDVVYIDFIYDWINKTGKKFFVTYLGDDYVLLADTKKDAMQGNGNIYAVCDIREGK